MPTKLKQLEITKVDLCKAGADPDADIMIFKSLDEIVDPATKPKEDTTVSKKIAKPEDLAKASPEDVKAYVDQLEKTLADQEQELEKAKKPAPVEPKGKAEPDDVTKGLSPEVKKMLDEQAEEIKKARQEAAEAREEVKKAQAHTEFVELKKTVEKDMPSIPGTVDEIAKMIQEAKTVLTAASYAVLEKALKAGSAAIAKASAELGAGGTKPTGSAEEEINKMADEKVAKNECKTRPEAIQKVASEHPDLYQRYKSEQRNRRAA